MPKPLSIHCKNIWRMLLDLRLTYREKFMNSSICTCPRPLSVSFQFCTSQTSWLVYLAPKKLVCLLTIEAGSNATECNESSWATIGLTCTNPYNSNDTSYLHSWNWLHWDWAWWVQMVCIGDENTTRVSCNQIWTPRRQTDTETNICKF